MTSAVDKGAGVLQCVCVLREVLVAGWRARSQAIDEVARRQRKVSAAR